MDLRYKYTKWESIGQRPLSFEWALSPRVAIGIAQGVARHAEVEMARDEVRMLAEQVTRGGGDAGTAGRLGVLVGQILGTPIHPPYPVAIIPSGVGMVQVPKGAGKGVTQPTYTSDGSNL